MRGSSQIDPGKRSRLVPLEIFEGLSGAVHWKGNSPASFLPPPEQQQHLHNLAEGNPPLPRLVPGKDQLIPAEWLRHLGIVDVVHWQDFTPETPSSWLHRKIDLPGIRSRVDLTGLTRVCHFLSELVAERVGLAHAALGE